MKSGVISIQPQWVAKILRKTKKGELRKTAPKEWIDYLNGKTQKKPEPMTFFVYVTNSKEGWCMVGINGNETYYEKRSKNGVFSPNHNYIGNGKIVAKFTLNCVERVCTSFTDTRWFYVRGKEETKINSADIFNRGWQLKRLCDCDFAIFDYYFEEKVDNTEYGRYRTYQVGYVWHIDNLEIFDEPKYLCDFWNTKKGVFCCPLTKAPQSWCYVKGE